MSRIVAYQTLGNLNTLFGYLDDIKYYYIAGEYENMGKVVASCYDILT